MEYAYQYRRKYKTVWWTTAHSREALVRDFVAIAGCLDLLEKDAEDQRLVVGAVKRWFENNDDWLLVLDNAEDLLIAREFIPTGETGHILLTTLAQNTQPIAKRQPVEKMDLEEGVLFLLHRLGGLKKGEPLDSASKELREQAEALSRELDGLPLALDQAAAYIDETQSTLEKYFNLYQRERATLLDLRGQLSPDHPSVTVTFSLAFTKAESASPAAADLLRLCALFESDAIPEEIFIRGMEELGDVLGPAAANPIRLDDVIAKAMRFSLLQRNSTAGTLSIHRLVQAVLKEAMDSETQQIWGERAIRAVNKVFPDVEYSNWPLCSRLTPHAQSLVSLIDEYSFEFLEAARMMNQAGEYLNVRFQLAEAEPLFVRALAVREKVLGAEHLEVATSLSNLASLYGNQGKYIEAEPLFVRAGAIKGKALGAEHPDTADTLVKLAGLYENQGKYAEAESLFIRAVDIKERTLGEVHPDVATGLGGLAGLYCNRGRYAEAEPLFVRALDIAEKIYGEEHPNIGAALNNLAGLYDDQGKYTEAVSLLHRAITIAKKAFGEQHPNFATTLTNLALTYNNQGKYDKAELLFVRALSIKEKALGAEHLDVGLSLNNLALLYYNQDRYAEAEPHYVRALAIRERALGAEHPDVATSLNNLAALYGGQRKYTEAKALFERALAIRERALGLEHPDVGASLNNLAWFYVNQEKYAKAEVLYKRALVIAERAHGAEHPKVATTLHNLAILYNKQEQYWKMESLLKRALNIRVRALDARHPDRLATLKLYAGLLRFLKRPYEANKLERDIIGTQRKAKRKKRK